MQENTAQLFDQETLEAKKAQPHPMAYEFLPEYLEVLDKPPSRGARYFVLGIIALALITLTWAILGRIDIVASAKGRLIVDDRSKVVQAPNQGEVRVIRVRDGQAVQEGDILIELNRTSSEAESERLGDRLIKIGLDIARSEALLSKDPELNFSPTKYLSSYPIPADWIDEARVTLQADMLDYDVRKTSLKHQLTQNQTQQALAAKVSKETIALIQNATARLESRKRLLDKGHIPRLEYLELEKELIQEERDLAQLIADAAELELQGVKLQQQLKQLSAENKKALHERLTELRSEFRDIQKQLIQANELLRQTTITAPVNGVVQQLAVHTLGGVVSQGQELMIIVPEGAELEAEVAIENKDVGFIRAGQSVEVKIDSFPYTRYGTVKGEVIHVSLDSMEDEQRGLVYPARVKLKAQSVQSDAEIIPLSAGMSIAAEIKTGDRRVIDYLLSPLKEYQSESLKER